MKKYIFTLKHDWEIHLLSKLHGEIVYIKLHIIYEITDWVFNIFINIIYYTQSLSLFVPVDSLSIFFVMISQFACSIL